MVEITDKNKMAAPIRYDFPASKLLFEKSSLLNEKSRHGKHIDSHFFNYAVRYLYINYEAVERLLMVRWVVGSIPHGGSIQQFLAPASASRLV